MGGWSDTNQWGSEWLLASPCLSPFRCLQGSLLLTEPVGSWVGGRVGGGSCSALLVRVSAGLFATGGCATRGEGGLVLLVAPSMGFSGFLELDFWGGGILQGLLAPFSGLCLLGRMH